VYTRYNTCLNSNWYRNVPESLKWVYGRLTANIIIHQVHVFLDFLCMDRDEVSNATMCPTPQCTTCWCPKEHLSDPNVVYPFRETADIRERVADSDERKKLLHRDGRLRYRCNRRCYPWGISVIWMVDHEIMSGYSYNYEWNITKLVVTGFMNNSDKGSRVSSGTPVAFLISCFRHAKKSNPSNKISCLPASSGSCNCKATSCTAEDFPDSYTPYCMNTPEIKPFRASTGLCSRGWSY
jgi:hypothetical protein